MVEPGLIVGERGRPWRERARLRLTRRGAGPGPVTAFAVLVPVRLTPVAFHLDFPDQGVVHDPGQIEPQAAGCVDHFSVQPGAYLDLHGFLLRHRSDTPTGPQGANPCGPGSSLHPRRREAFGTDRLLNDIGQEIGDAGRIQFAPLGQDPGDPLDGGPVPIHRGARLGLRRLK